MKPCRSIATRLFSLLLAAAIPSAAETTGRPATSSRAEPGQRIARDVPAERDVPAAESLYEAGRQLLLDGQCEFAIERLQASQSLDPAVGTLLLLGHCQEKLGKTASAWASFRSARSLAQSVHQPDREQIADARARALEPRLARIEIWLPNDVDTRAWSVIENGRELPRALLGVALPVDPGPRELRVSAPGYEPWTGHLVIDDAGDTTRVRVPQLVPLASAAAASASSAPRVTVEPAPLVPAPPLLPIPDRAAPSSNGGLLRAFSYLGVGLGAVGLGVGATYGILARERFDEAVRECPGGDCTMRGKRLRQSGDRHATIATVSAIGGAVLVAGGLGLWLAMPSAGDTSSSAAVGVTPIGSEGLSLEMVGAF
jgi:hypothetical protein